MKNFIIAIDGFSSCGKSTLAKALAKHLNFIYIDSGAMYRAVTLYFLRNNIDSTAPAEQLEQLLENIHLEFVPSNGQTYILLNGEDVSEEIRKMYVSNKVSYFSQLECVRTELVRQQQRIGNEKNIIMDGRDIGTAVFPNAQIKLFMTADPKVRAKRRYQELCSKNESVTLEEVYTNLAQRDYNDTTRKVSPLICAKDAVVIDNSCLTEAEQLQIVLEIAVPLVTREAI